MKKIFKLGIICVLLSVLLFGLLKIQTALFEANNTPPPVHTRQSNNLTDWNLILVNQHHPIPNDYHVELINLSNGQQVDTRIYPSLQQMFDDARTQGVYPVVLSGYRTENEQMQIMQTQIEFHEAEGNSKAEAIKLAKAWVAIPGTSEHQLGLAIDIEADNINSTNEQVYEWLRQNAHEYGFILRYPMDKIDITGINYEPWHYRYVGIDTAQEIYSQGICLEEYLSMHLSQ
jgi:D-alanyl-D-alanine carboxypeptidase